MRPAELPRPVSECGEREKENAGTTPISWPKLAQRSPSRPGWSQLVPTGKNGKARGRLRRRSGEFSRFLGDFRQRHENRRFLGRCRSSRERSRRRDLNIRIVRGRESCCTAVKSRLSSPSRRVDSVEGSEPRRRCWTSLARVIPCDANEAVSHKSPQRSSAAWR